MKDDDEDDRQPKFWDLETPRWSKHIETSREAAESMAGECGRLQKLLYEHILGRRYYGATDQEVERDLGIHRQTMAPRRFELVNDLHLIRVDYDPDHPRRVRTRRNVDTGRSCRVYVANEFYGSLDKERRHG